VHEEEPRTGKKTEPRYLYTTGTTGKKRCKTNGGITKGEAEDERKKNTNFFIFSNTNWCGRWACERRGGKNNMGDMKKQSPRTHE